jgi:hypothetical protein
MGLLLAATTTSDSTSHDSLGATGGHALEAFSKYTEHMRRLLIRSRNPLLGYLLIVLCVVVGGILGSVFGIWVAVLWDAAVICAVASWVRLRAKAGGRRIANDESANRGCRQE